MVRVAAGDSPALVRHELFGSRLRKSLRRKIPPCSLFFSGAFFWWCAGRWRYWRSCFTHSCGSAAATPPGRNRRQRSDGVGLGCNHASGPAPESAIPGLRVFVSATSLSSCPQSVILSGEDGLASRVGPRSRKTLCLPAAPPAKRAAPIVPSAKQVPRLRSG